MAGWAPRDGAEAGSEAATSGASALVGTTPGNTELVNGTRLLVAGCGSCGSCVVVVVMVMVVVGVGADPMGPASPFLSMNGGMVWLCRGFRCGFDW